MDKYRKTAAKFYNKQYKMLKYFALWELPPNTSEYFKKLYQIYFWSFFISWILIFDLVMALHIIIHIDSIEEVINAMFMLATSIGMLGKFLVVKTKSQAFEDFFKLLLNERYLPQNPEEAKIFEKYVELSSKVRTSYSNFAYTSCCGFFLSEYLSGSGKLPVSVYCPFGIDTPLKYHVMYVYVCLALFVVCLVNIPFDSLSTSFFMNLEGQLAVLGHRLENIGRNRNSTQDSILQQLKDCVRYYNCIYELTHNIEYLVSVPMSLQVACSVFVLIANFYVMSTLSGPGEVGKLVKFTIYQLCMLSQIFMLCYFANELSLKSSEISYNLYDSDWYNWNKINRKLVLLMMLRFEAPMRIASVNRCYSFNLAAFTSIVNSSYSYFTLLKRTNHE